MNPFPQASRPAFRHAFRKSALACGALAVAALPAPAGAMSKVGIGAELGFAQSFNGSSVARGRSTELGFLAVFDTTTCARLGRTKVRVNQPPNGRVTTAPASRAFGAGQIRSSKCAGKPFSGVRVVYTPKPGFSGSETFSINVSYPTDGGGRRTSTEGFRFTVR